jgi:hypothetical protein
VYNVNTIPRMRLFSSSVAGYVVLVLLLASVAVGQDEEGSGDGYEDDEDGESPSVPSRPTTPQLVDPSPTMDIVPTKTRAAVTEGATTRVVGDADSIYVRQANLNFGVFRAKCIRLDDNKDSPYFSWKKVPVTPHQTLAAVAYETPLAFPVRQQLPKCLRWSLYRGTAEAAR